MTREDSVLREWTLSWQYIGMRATCFSQNGRFFWQYIGMRASFFSWKIEKKRASYWIFWPIIKYIFDRIGVFWPIICMLVEVFHEKFEKNDIRAMFLREETFFWQNMGMRAKRFLEIGRFFDRIWAREKWFFREKSWKKMHPINLAHYISKF